VAVGPPLFSHPRKIDHESALTLIGSPVYRLFRTYTWSSSAPTSTQLPPPEKELRL